VDDDFLLMVNAWWEPLEFVIPATRPGQVWHGELDTFDPTRDPVPAPLSAGGTVTVGARSVVLLRGPRSRG